MEAILAVIGIILLLAVLTSTTEENKRLEVENEAYRIVIASMQREDETDRTGGQVGLVVLILGLLTVLAVVAIT